MLTGKEVLPPLFVLFKRPLAQKEMGLVKKEMSIEGGAIERICRICARSKSQTHISYVNVSQIENLQQKLLKYLNINVTGEDPLPKSICIKCFRMLNLLHEFVLMSRESQKVSAIVNKNVI